MSDESEKRRLEWCAAHDGNGHDHDGCWRCTDEVAAERDALQAQLADAKDKLYALSYEVPLLVGETPQLAMRRILVERAKLEAQLDAARALLVFRATGFWGRSCARLTAELAEARAALAEMVDTYEEEVTAYPVNDEHPLLTARAVLAKLGGGS